MTCRRTAGTNPKGAADAVFSDWKHWGAEAFLEEFTVPSYQNDQLKEKIYAEAKKRYSGRPRWNRLWRQRLTPRGSISPNKMNRAAPYLFLSRPYLAGAGCVFVLVPFADAVRRSFTDAMGSRFVGVANYASVLGNSAFRLAAGNTARFIGVCVPLLLCVSLLLAVAVRAAKDGGRIFKTTYLIPMAIPVASIVLLWQALFHRQGLVNAVLSALARSAGGFYGHRRGFLGAHRHLCLEKCGL